MWTSSSHRYDPDTPLEETLQALVDIVRQGSTLCRNLQISQRGGRVCLQIPGRTDVHCLLLSRQIQSSSTANRKKKVSCSKPKGTERLHRFSLAQGLLTNRYLNGIPEDSRMAKGAFLKKEALDRRDAAKNQGTQRGCCLTRATPCRDVTCLAVEGRLQTSVIIGASSITQLADNPKATENTDFSAEELEKIKKIIQK